MKTHYGILWLLFPILLQGCACDGSRSAVAPEHDRQPPSLEALIAQKWGEDRVLLPSPTMWVEYEEDLGERWVVDFDSGEVMLEALWNVDQGMADPLVLSAMAKAVSNLYTSVPVHPRDMFERQLEIGYIPGDVPRRQPKARERPKRHTVRKGDTLSEIAKRYRVTTKDLAGANSIRDADKIRIGQVLKMPEPRHHMHAEGEEHQRATESLLAGQVVDPDSGKGVDASTVGKFGQQIVKRNGVQKEVVRGADGQKRAVSRLKFSLAEKHLQIRAQRYYPLVESSAQRFDLDTALIMAMVHTESAFNPMAASRAKAYGLMQLIPSQGGKDAYRWLYGRNQEPSRSYLMQPRENVELGTAYMKILGDKVFSKVTNPRSRLYCSVAAYNAGSRNVGKTFTGRKSVQASVGTINSMSPEQVYQRLKTSAPSRETREYVKQVFERTAIYRTPAWPPLG